RSRVGGIMAWAPAQKLSALMASLPARVPSARQVTRETESFTKRTEPSHSSRFTPPGWALEAMFRMRPGGNMHERVFGVLAWPTTHETEPASQGEPWFETPWNVRFVGSIPRQSAIALSGVSGNVFGQSRSVTGEAMALLKSPL